MPTHHSRWGGSAFAEPSTDPPYRLHRWRRGCRRSGFRREEGVDQEHGPAAHEAAIGDVEDGPVNSIKVEEVADAVEHDPVVEVSQGAAEDQPKRGAEPTIDGRGSEARRPKQRSRPRPGCSPRRRPGSHRPCARRRARTAAPWSPAASPARSRLVCVERAVARRHRGSNSAVSRPIPRPLRARRARSTTPSSGRGKSQRNMPYLLPWSAANPTTAKRTISHR